MKKSLYLLIFISSITYAMKFDVISTKTKLKIGTIDLKDSKWGLLIHPEIVGLKPGSHGFHIHTNPSCNDTITNNQIILAGAAGGHYDPDKTNKHLGPYNIKGHLGDLPLLIVRYNSKANVTLLAPRLKLKMLKNRSLIIHKLSDNYKDKPKKLGGGGARVACLVIKNIDCKQKTQYNKLKHNGKN